MIPFIDLQTQQSKIREAIDASIKEVLDDGRYVLGPAVKKFEDELAEFVDCKEAISVSSGTDALFIPLLAKGIGAGDAVFVPSFTYTATAEVILLAGATPVFVDVDEDTFNIDMESLRENIEKTKAEGKLRLAAILAVDLFGQPADYTAINTIADHEGMLVIADAAQALGGSEGNKRIGSLTHCTGTSFYPSKPLGCYGDGGAIFTDDAEFAATMRSVRTHGQGTNKYDVVRIGLNGRLDSIQAAILSVKLSIFEQELEAREAVARIYDEGIKNVVSVPTRVPNSSSAWAQYTIKTDDRENLQHSLKEAGVPSMIFYPQPMHFQPAYEEFGKGPGSLPVSEKLCQQVLSLPMHPYMPKEQTLMVCNEIRAHFE